MKKDILILTENPIPAKKRVSRIHYLSETLAEKGFEVRTITFRSEENNSIPGCIHIYLPVYFKQFDMVKRILFFLSFFYVIKEILKSRPSVLHGQGFIAGLIICLCSYVFKIPCIVGMPDFVETLYGSFKFPFAALGTKILMLLENFAARNTDALIVESEMAKSEWIRRGVDKNKIYPIHHAADIFLFNPNIEGNDVRRAYGIDDKIIITYHGDIGDDDGVDILIRSFQKITEKHPDARLMIIGSGTNAIMDELKKLASELNEKVIFTGWIPYREIAKYIAASDIGVAPFRSTLYTNTVVPTKALEIMAMEKPAVISDLTTFSKYLSHGKDCLLVKPGHVEDLTISLLKLINNPELRYALGKKGRRLVEEKFTWTAKNNEELEVIRSLAKH